MKNTTFLIIVMGVVVAASISLSGTIGGSGSDFLQYSNFARSTALGNSGRALLSDITATLFNSACLAENRVPNLSFTKADLVMGTQFLGVGGILPFEAATVAFSWMSYRTDDIEKHGIVANSTPEGYISYLNDLYILSIATHFTHEISIGISNKLQIRKMDTSQDSVYVADVGFLFKQPRYQLGVNLSNVVSVKRGDTSDTFPMEVAVGISYSPIKAIYLLADAANLMSGHPRYSEGIEYYVLGSLDSENSFALRLGTNDSNISAGLGCRLGLFKFDYAFAPTDIETKHQVAFSLCLDALNTPQDRNTAEHVFESPPVSAKLVVQPVATLVQ